jgi:hypothetical protein
MSAVDIHRSQLKASIEKARLELEQLEKAYRALGGAPVTGSLVMPTVDDRLREAIAKPPTLNERITRIVSQYTNGREFTVPDVESQLLSQQQYTIPGKARARIAMALKELENDGVVRVTDRPGGGKPHVYALAKP